MMDLTNIISVDSQLDTQQTKGLKLFVGFTHNDKYNFKSPLVLPYAVIPFSFCHCKFAYVFSLIDFFIKMIFDMYLLYDEIQLNFKFNYN